MKHAAAEDFLNGRRTAENYIDECVLRKSSEPDILYRILIQMTQDDKKSRATLCGFADRIHSWMGGAQNMAESAETRVDAGIEVVPEKTVHVPLESNMQKVHIPPTTAKFAAVPTDEQIKEIWNSLGYRTRFAPYLLRLVRAVLSHVEPPPLTDAMIVEAVHKACGEGRVTLIWINNKDIEKPTDVAKCFAKALGAA